MSIYGTTHWLTLDSHKEVIVYLKGSTHLALQFTKSPSLDICAYHDTNSVSCPDNRHSMCCFCIFLGDNLIYWHLSNHKVFLRSSTEFEYRALLSIASKILWIQSILTELCVDGPRSLHVYCGNLNAKSLTENHVFYARIKHIEID